MLKEKLDGIERRKLKSAQTLSPRDNNHLHFRIWPSHFCAISLCPNGFGADPGADGARWGLRGGGQVPRQVTGVGACVIAGTWSEQTQSVSRATSVPEKLPCTPQILSSFAYSPHHNPYYIFNTFPACLKLYKTNTI